MVRMLLFCFIGTVTVVQATPLLVANTSLWNKKTKIWIANCSSLEQKNCANALPKNPLNNDVICKDLLRVTSPEAPWDSLKDYKAFKLKQKTRSVSIFGIFSQGMQKNGVLYQMDGETGRIMQYFTMPFAIQQGFLAVSDVYSKGTWRTMLAVSITHTFKSEASILVFDITDPTKPLEASLLYNKKESIVQFSRPVFIRFKEGTFGIAMGGYSKDKGMFWMFSLEDARSPIQLTMGQSALSFLSAIDSNASGVVDTIYAADGQHAWSFDLTHSNCIEAKQISDTIEPSSSFKVIKNKQSPGVRLYCLGSDKETMGLFGIQDPVPVDKKAVIQKMIIKGDYQDIKLRFGQLILIPKQGNAVATVIRLANHQKLSIKWNSISQSKNDESNIVASHVLWDPEEQQEVLITLNTSCQLNVSAARLNTKEYSRMAWREISQNIIQSE